MGRACAVNCTTGAALIFLGFWLVPGTACAASSGDTHDTVEKGIPQGKDPPGTDVDLKLRVVDDFRREHARRRDRGGLSLQCSP